MAPSEDYTALDKLKSILLEQEKERLTHLEIEVEKLNDQLQDKERLIESLDPIIADLLYQKIIESRAQMAEALAPVMGSAIRKQIDTAKDDIADALYPVIGKAVRKSVAEAMKKMLQTINERIDNVVSKSLHFGKRIDKNLILKESFPFHLREIFLIHKDTGILLSHVSSANIPDTNEDLVSGMLTAIRDFSKTAFKTGSDELHEIQYDNLNIIIEDGKYAYLAFVIEGVPGNSLKEIIKDLENKIHLRFYKNMREFDGDIAAYSPVNTILRDFIKAIHEPFFTQALKTQSDKSKPKGLIYLVIFLIILLSAFYIVPLLQDKAISPTEIIEKYQGRNGNIITYTHNQDNLVLSGIITPEARNNLIRDLDDYKIDVTNLFDRPSLSAMQRILEKVKIDLGLEQADIKVGVDSMHIVLFGDLPDARARILFADLFSQQTKIPVILNNLTINSIVDEVKIAVDSFTVYFNVGAYQLDQSGRQKLDDLADILDDLIFKSLIIEGHADSSGSPALNDSLSMLRAVNVRDYLIQKGINSSKMQAISMGLNSGKDASKFLNDRRASFHLVR